MSKRTKLEIVTKVGKIQLRAGTLERNLNRLGKNLTRIEKQLDFEADPKEREWLFIKVQIDACRIKQDLAQLQKELQEQ